MELFHVVVRRRSCVATTGITSCPVLVVISLSNVFESERGEAPSQRIGPHGILATYLPSRVSILGRQHVRPNLRPSDQVGSEPAFSGPTLSPTNDTHVTSGVV
jgi:hypothetical protein